MQFMGPVCSRFYKFLVPALIIVKKRYSLNILKISQKFAHIFCIKSAKAVEILIFSIQGLEKVQFDFNKFLMRSFTPKIHYSLFGKFCIVKLKFESKNIREMAELPAKVNLLSATLVSDSVMSSSFNTIVVKNKALYSMSERSDLFQKKLNKILLKRRKI